MTSKFRAPSTPFNKLSPSGRAVTITNGALLDECARIAKLTGRPVQAVVHDAVRLGVGVLTGQVKGKAQP